MRRRNKSLGRFRSAVSGVFIGIVFVLLCPVGLAWNEARSIKAIRAYDEAEKAVVELGNAEIRPENEGKLVAAQGTITSSANAKDTYYNVEGNFTLRRTVEVYHWEEKKKGSSTDQDVTYTYNLVWTTSPISSSSFDDVSKRKANAWPTGANFENANVDHTVFYGDSLRLGEFGISADHIKQLENFVAINIPGTANMPAGYYISQDNRYITTIASRRQPQANDVRISFTVAASDQASVLAKQSGGELTAFTTKNKSKINSMYAGLLSGADMIKNLREENSTLTWVLRLGLAFFIYVGFSMLFTPIEVLVRHVPRLGNFLGRFTKRIVNFISAVCAVLLSVVVIAISWITVRPLLAIPSLILIGGLVYLLIRMRKKIPADEE